jgi:hypothetical protein
MKEIQIISSIEANITATNSSVKRRRDIKPVNFVTG